MTLFQSGSWIFAVKVAMEMWESLADDKAARITVAVDLVAVVVAVVKKRM
jgi:hypothetical protein